MGLFETGSNSAWAGWCSPCHPALCVLRREPCGTAPSATGTGGGCIQEGLWRLEPFGDDPVAGVLPPVPCSCSSLERGQLWALGFVPTSVPRVKLLGSSTQIPAWPVPNRQGVLTSTLATMSPAPGGGPGARRARGSQGCDQSHCPRVQEQLVVTEAQPPSW